MRVLNRRTVIMEVRWHWNCWRVWKAFTRNWWLIFLKTTWNSTVSKTLKDWIWISNYVILLHKQCLVQCLMWWYKSTTELQDKQSVLVDQLVNKSYPLYRQLRTFCLILNPIPHCIWGIRCSFWNNNNITKCSLCRIFTDECIGT